MIPESPLPRHHEPSRWQQALQECVTDPEALVLALGLDSGWIAPARKAAARFPLRVPRSYLARMRPQDPADPLLRQVLPLWAELIDTPGYVSDPVGDLHAVAGPGLLHKYQGRALLITTGACAIHCRYCFRREFPYDAQNAGRGAFAEALAAVRADTSITEVLLSGGDPLNLGDRRLAGLLQDLEAIPHVQRVRVHTRLPIVLPERIDAGFLAVWNGLTRLQRVMVVHANHAQELRAAVDVHFALRQLSGSSTTLLNQSVLLRGVNDSVDALAELSETLFAHGVLPYYLHVLDPVRGAAHFDVPEDEARDLVSRLALRLPGYLVPRLVRETPGAGAKTMLQPASR
ncbi:MAG TPA: EF-P beta-lysylation protein EpmB [Steroidobacteraceae bacterium]